MRRKLLIRLAGALCKLSNRFSDGSLAYVWIVTKHGGMFEYDHTDEDLIQRMMDMDNDTPEM